MFRLEENLGIIVASVATILPLFQQFQPKARIHSSATDDTFALKRNVTKVKTTNHGTASSLEEGLLPLHPTAITKTTAFKIDRAGNSNLRPETGVGFDESWRPSVWVTCYLKFHRVWKSGWEKKLLRPVVQALSIVRIVWAVVTVFHRASNIVNNTSVEFSKNLQRWGPRRESGLML